MTAKEEMELKKRLAALEIKTRDLQDTVYKYDLKKRTEKALEISPVARTAKEKMKNFDLSKYR